MMFKQKPINKLYAFALAAVFALTLAGCGGGGGTAQEPEPAPMQTPQEMCEGADGRWNADNTCTTAAELAAEQEAMDLAAAQTAAQEAYDAAKAAVDAAAANRDSAPDSYDAALRALGAAEAANNTAQAATTSDAAEAAQGNAETARDNAVRYAGMVNQAKADADAAAAAATAKAAANKEARTKITAINAEAAETTDTSVGNPSTAITVAVKYGDIKVTDSANNDDDDPKFMANGNEFTRTMDDDVDVVVVHTDIDAPKATAFKTVYPFDATESGGATAADDDPFVGLDLGDTIDTNSPAEDQATLKRIMASRFTAGSASVLTFDADEASTTNTDESARVSGTYDGATGTYECTGTTDCTVTLNAKGEIIGISDGWTFFPADGVTVDVPDSDYMTYGFWVNKTVEDGVTTYNSVQTYATSSLAATTTVADVTVNATYEGRAAGVYGHKTFMENGAENVVSAGTFTADVELTAYFGEAETVAASKHNSVHGTVSGFVLSGGQDNNWSLKLESDDDAIADVAGAIVVSGTTDGGGVHADGANDWNGAFHGAATADDGATTNVNESAGPPVLVGEFNGHFINGHVAGAFGTRLEKE